MAPPQLFIISKTVELKKQTDNDNEDRSDAVVAENDQQESRAEKKDERYENDVADPTGTEESDGEKENRNAKSLRPAHILVFIALAVAFVGVSFNKKNNDMTKYDSLLSRLFCGRMILSSVTSLCLAFISSYFVGSTSP